MRTSRGRLLVAMLAIGALAASGATGKATTDAERAAVGPACMHCGSTCRLRAICVCEPGTAKKPRTEYDVTCEPVCMPGPGRSCCPRTGAAGAGCTACAPPFSCPGRVRHRKTLRRETVEDEVCVVARQVAYVCEACSTGRGVGCTGSKSSLFPEKGWFPAFAAFRWPW
jgi:hypothetical protein